MGVYIKGMDMPKEGTVIVIDSAGQVWSNEWPTRGYIRLDGVTAVPVPPHGRLIDADAMIKDMEVALWDWETVDGIAASTILKQTITDLRNTPTLIPASEECE